MQAHEKVEKKIQCFFHQLFNNYFQKPKDCLMTCGIVAWLEKDTTQHIERNQKKKRFLANCNKSE